MRQRLAEMQTAVILLTRVPFGRLRDPVPPLGASAWAFPLAGLPVGLIAAGVLAASLALGLSPPVAGGLVLVAQVTGTVRWRESIAWIAEQGVTRFVEVGSGKVLTGLLKRIAAGAAGLSVGAPADIESFRAAG